MSFSKNIFLSALTCFTLGSGALFSTPLYIYNGSTAARNICCTSTNPNNCGANGVEAGLYAAAYCWSSQPTWYSSVQVTTDALQSAGPDGWFRGAGSGVLPIYSTNWRGTWLHGHPSQYSFRTDSVGAIIEIGPAATANQAKIGRAHV